MRSRNNYTLPTASPTPSLQTPSSQTPSSQPKMQGKGRSRWGCNNCKLRHLKCSETRPKCDSCVSKNLNCSYEFKLQFKDDLLKQNKAFGREGVWSKANKSKVSKGKNNQTMLTHENVHFVKFKVEETLRLINFNYDDFEHSKFDHFDRDDLQNPYLTRYIGKTSELNFSILKAFSGSSLDGNIFNLSKNNLHYALTFYMDRISPFFNPIDIDHIGFMGNSQQMVMNRHHFANHEQKLTLHNGLDMKCVLRYSQSFNYVYALVLSLSSLYLSNSSLINKTQRKNWLLEAERLRNLGLKLLLNEVNKYQSLQTLRVDFLLSFLLITLYDLANGCNKNWSNQLQSCKHLLNQSTTVDITNSVESSIYSYTVDFFLYQESLGRTACNNSRVFNQKLIKNESEEPEEEVVLITWMGCDKRLVNVISDITDLSYGRFGCSDFNTFVIQANKVVQKIESIKLKDFQPDKYLFNFDNSDFLDLKINEGEFEDFSIYLNGDVSNNFSDVEEFCFLLTCEVKRLCSIIYCECSLFNKSPSDKGILNLIDQLYKYIKFINMESNYKWSSLTWPLYIISCELNLLENKSELQKLNILKMFDLINGESLGNVNKVKHNVEKIWKRRFLNNYEIKLNVNDTEHKNDWEYFVVDANCNLSLT